MATSQPPSQQPGIKKGVNLASFDESMNSAACLQWLSVELNRQPEPYDLYHIGKSLYQTGRYLGASTLLQLYVDGPGNEIPGHHLLGYAYYMIEEKRKAVKQIKKVVNSGFDADWQLLIELQVDLDRGDGLLPPPLPEPPNSIQSFTDLNKHRHKLLIWS